MKPWLMASMCAFGLTALAGCSNDHIISTSDGRMIEAEDKPEIDDETGMLRYEDDDGKENQVPQSDVREIRER